MLQIHAPRLVVLSSIYWFVFTTFTIVEIVYSEDINHYAYVVAFLCIVIGLLWGRFKAIHVFAAPVLLLILSGFMVMGPGNYSNQDFLKLGLHVLIVYSIAALLILL